MAKELVVDGRRASQAEFEDEASTAQLVIVIARDGDVTQAAFADGSAPESWLSDHGIRDPFQLHEDAVRRVRSLGESDRDEVVETIARAHEVSHARLEGLAERGAIDPRHPGTPPNALILPTSAAVLYQDCGFQGRWIFLAGGLAPDFRRLNFNDLTSAIRLFTSLGFFYEHIWFGGRRFVLFGIWSSVECLVDVGFNDIISSAWL